MSRVINRRGGPTSPAGIFGKVKQQLVLKIESEVLKRRADTLRDDIMKFLEANGTADEKGSLLIELPDTLSVAGKEFRSIKRERRVSSSFDEEAAEQLLHTKGLLARVQKSTVKIISSMPVGTNFDVDDTGVHSGANMSFLGEKVGDAIIEWTTHLDQNEIYVLNQEGLITNEELDQLFVESISWAYKPINS